MPSTLLHPSDCVFGVVGGHVVSVELATGTEVWRTRIPKGSTYVASVLVRDGCVVVGCGGRLHCFDAHHGTLLWTNELKGLGYNTVFLGSSGDAQAAAIAAQQAAHSASVAATAT